MLDTLIVYSNVFPHFQIESVQWTFDKLPQDIANGELQHFSEFLAETNIDLIINLPMRNGGAKRMSSFVTHGYRTRRMAVDLTIPLVTDIKCTKLLIEAMRVVGNAPPMKTHTDCMTSRNIKKLPGFIDVHVHLRDPGATHKEDFASGTAAALAGGITMVLAMPNTTPTITDRDSFALAQDIARLKAHCDYGIYVGASSDNYNVINELAPHAAALKMYLNQTFSTLQLTDMLVWEKHLKNWPKRAPLVVHAERQSTAAIIFLASVLDRSIHVAHVARKEEIAVVRAAKERGIKITCEVCPHHLFLSTQDVDRIGSGRSEVRPVLCTPEDQEALWENMDIIDVFATDHAPHTIEEKNSDNPPPGFPGLETILPLLLNAVHEGRLTLEDVINKFHRNPRKIFNLPEQPNTYIEVDMDDEWVIPEQLTHSKAKWTPFAGYKVRGSVHRVVLRGEVAFVDGEVLVQPGYGQNIREYNVSNHEKFKKSLDSVEIVDTNGHEYEALNGKFEPRLDLSSEHNESNDFFSRMLSEPTSGKQNVHFAPNERYLRPVSPAPRVRCDSAGNTTLKELVQHTTHASNIPVQHELHGKHILSVDMFTKEHLNDIFNLAHIFKSRVAKDRPIDDILRGRIMASVFYEVSTRTSASFAAAMLRLGGRVINMSESSSSVQKGETLEDSIAVLASYADVVVLRHPAAGAVMVSQLTKCQHTVTVC